MVGIMSVLPSPVEEQIWNFEIMFQWKKICVSNMMKTSSTCTVCSGSNSHLFPPLCFNISRATTPIHSATEAVAITLIIYEVNKSFLSNERE